MWQLHQRLWWTTAGCSRSADISAPDNAFRGRCDDLQLFLEVTGPGGSGKSVMASIAHQLAGEDNTTAATIDTLDSSRERASVVGYSLIILPNQKK